VDEVFLLNHTEKIWLLGLEVFLADEEVVKYRFSNMKK